MKLEIVYGDGGAMSEHVVANEAEASAIICSAEADPDNSDGGHWTLHDGQMLVTSGGWGAEQP